MPRRHVTTMLRGLVLMGAPHALYAATASSGSGDGSHGGTCAAAISCTIDEPLHFCRNLSYTEFDEYVRSHCGVEDADERRGVIIEACDSLCPSPKAADFSRSCQHHSAHTTHSLWLEALTAHTSLQWNVFFVVACLIVGSVLQRSIPKSIPYTVGILVIFLLLGFTAELLMQGDDCPWNAWVYASEHTVDVHGHPQSGMMVSPVQWAEFIGDGSHPGAFCIVGEGGTRGKPRSCGDGSSSPAGCRWTFDGLDAPFKLSAMLPISVENEVEGYLSADELWTVRCNLLRDMLGLSVWGGETNPKTASTSPDHTSDGCWQPLISPAPRWTALARRPRALVVAKWSWPCPDMDASTLLMTPDSLRRLHASSHARWFACIARLAGHRSACDARCLPPCAPVRVRLLRHRHGPPPQATRPGT